MHHETNHVTSTNNAPAISYSVATPTREQIKRLADPLVQQSSYYRTHSQAKPKPFKPHQSGRALNSSYIPGLDGLRALAIISVVSYHILPHMFMGGFIGVDLFFVLSGFLITYRILEQIANGPIKEKFSLKNFWLRRIRRLVPAFIFLILICVPAAYIIYNELLVGVSRQVFGALTYTTNWIEIYHGFNYFDAANPSLFKNFWSLAVEEQFYLLWPPLLLLLLKAKVKHPYRLLIIFAIGLLSLFGMKLLASGENFTRVYYGTDTHCFGLAAGILLAFIWNKTDGVLSKVWLSRQKWTFVLAPIGFIGFTTLVFYLPDTSAFTYPYGLGLSTLFSFSMVASVLLPNSFSAKIGEFAPLRWLGIRSYGIYLWHWPLLIFGRILIPTAVNSLASIAVDLLFVVLSLVISALSFTYLEEPMRKHGIMPTIKAVIKRAHSTWSARLTLLLSLVLLVATLAAIIYAPAKTHLQMQIEELEQETNQTSGQAPNQRYNTDQKETTKSDDKPKTKKKSPEGQEILDTNTIANFDPEETTGIPSGKTLTAIGDSLISGNAIGFREVFKGIDLIAKPSRQWNEAVSIVTKALEKHEIRQNVILDFGTNGGVTDERYIRQIINKLGDKRRIVLFNIYSPSTFVDKANKIYAKIADEYPNVYLADWYSIAANHPEYLSADRTHPNTKGAYAFVGLAKSVFKEH